ncbi:hypothetical protein FH880_08005 [Salmonella enterica]|nr:hypothetical protein [Salmonella enterica]EAW0462783.1 hypothetical protein [Salmonella enterica]EBF9108789.1 hypothetical protein [Salmonella enterica]
MDIKTSSNDEFNLLTGQIFAHLFEQFPVPSRLDVDMFFDDTHFYRMRRRHEESDSEFPFNIEEVNHLHDEKLELFIHTVNWLESEGFIRCEIYSPLGMQPEYTDVVLTHRAMQFLNIIPGSLATSEHKKSAIGEMLSDAVKENSRSLLIYGVKVLFKYWQDSA